MVLCAKQAEREREREREREIEKERERGKVREREEKERGKRSSHTNCIITFDHYTRNQDHIDFKAIQFCYDLV